MWTEIGEEKRVLPLAFNKALVEDFILIQVIHLGNPFEVLIRFFDFIHSSPLLLLDMQVHLNLLLYSPDGHLIHAHISTVSIGDLIEGLYLVAQLLEEHQGHEEVDQRLNEQGFVHVIV